MHISGMIRNIGRASLAAACAFGASAILAQQAAAESVYIAQVPTQPVNAMALAPLAQGANPTGNWRSTLSHAVAPPPEAIAATRQNFAQTYQVGSYNVAFHAQSGANNLSTVGIIGSQNNVAVLQSGNNLKSNVVLLGTAGLNVGVLQPKGSVPVNLLVARLPGGGLLIKR